MLDATVSGLLAQVEPDHTLEIVFTNGPDGPAVAGIERDGAGRIIGRFSLTEEALRRAHGLAARRYQGHRTECLPLTSKAMQRVLNEATGH